MKNYRYDHWRLGYHLMPPAGWLNDPNGLCQMDGTYHVFFQYAPEYPKNNNKGWGHYMSRNLMDWTYAGMPLEPDQDFDKDGVYSGSALIEDDKMHLFYTGNVKEPGEHDYITSGRGAATVHVISEDGIQFGKKQCVMVNADYPENYTCHIRDPKVWKEDGQYYMVLGGRTREDEGRVLLYTSTDMDKWKLQNEFAGKEPFGYMWECPDLFAVDGQYLLSVSPQGVPREEYRYQNIYQSGYYKLNGDFRGEYSLEDFTQWDYGFDFYAPQTFMDEQGRRILIGWMGLPDIEAEYTNPSDENGWVHALTMLREVTLKEGKIRQNPVKEYQHLRKHGESFHAEKTYYLSNSFELDLSNPANDDFSMLLSDGAAMEYKAEQKEFSLCFTNHMGAGRRSRKIKVNECTKLHMFVDHSAIEIYLNEGEYVMTTRFYPKDNKAVLQTTSPTLIGNIWELEEMRVNML